MNNTLTILLILSWTSIGAIGVAEPVDTIFTQRRDAAVANIRKATPPDLLKNVDRGVEMALLLLFKNEKVDEANDTYEYWAKGAQLPKIDGKFIRYDCPTFNSPWLKDAFGSGVITLTGPVSGEKVILDFNQLSPREDNAKSPANP
jgi:hypothetical protein